MQKRKKKIIIGIILLLIALWFVFFFVDSSRVSDEKEPLFCIEKSKEHYIGLGYSFDIYQHPITGKWEYIEYIFDIEIKNNLTN